MLPPRLARLDMRTASPELKRADPFYLSRPWRSLVENLISARGRRCENCGKTREADGGRVMLIGDHIVERRDGGDDLNPANVQLLCARLGGDGRRRPDGMTGGCHAAKTAKARFTRMTTGRG